MTEKVERSGFRGFVARLSRAVFRFIAGTLKVFLIVVGLLVVSGVAGYFAFESVVEALDSRYAEKIDARFGTDAAAISRLNDPAYFAAQSEIVSEDLRTIACISSAEHRILLTAPEQVPPLFTKALLASEDRNFFTHEGVDKAAILRALVKQVLHESRSGASTLEMQVAKYLRGGTGRRSTESEKVADIITALRIARAYPKQQLLLKYANMPYFGRGQYGIEAASRAYFGRPAQDLALHQVAFIVSLINRPALPDRAYAVDPQLRTREEIREANWNETVRGTTRVLELMHDEDMISDVEFARAADRVAQSLRGEIVATALGCGAHDYFLERVRVLYKDRFPINKGGLTISITRDDGLQDALAKSVDLTLRTYLARHPDDKDNDQLRAGAFAVEFTGDVLAEVGNVNFDRQKFDVMAAGWRQPGSTFKIFTYGALIERLTGATIASEPASETVDEIAASTLKDCTVLDAPIFVSLGRGRGVKKIENFHSRSEPQYRGEISCQVALGESRNTAAMRAGARAGIKNVIELTYRLGMPRDPKHLLQPYPTTAIGASEVNPLSMATTAAFLNGGFRVAPRFVNDICHDGKSLIHVDAPDRPRACDAKGERRPVQERVIHPAVAAAMTDLLKAPIELATGTASALRRGTLPGVDPLGGEIWRLKPAEVKARTLAFPKERAGELAGKTGTATNADGKTSDVWLILWVPGPPDRPERGIVLGFWMGKDSKEHPLGERGSTGGPGLAESGGRNWVHSAATVLAFLQKERGLLRPENRFQPIMRDDVLGSFEARKPKAAPPEDVENP